MTVFVIQQQMRFDKTLNELVPRFPSVTKAEKWGELRYLLSPSASPFNPEHIVSDLHDKLNVYCDDDYLLLIGNPGLIGMATAIASSYNKGNVNFLQWSGKYGAYTEISANLY